MSSKANMGKWAEKQVLLWLTEASNKSTDLAFHLLPDAHAARGALAAQPADLMVVKSGFFYLLEVKETAQLSRLPKAKVSQWGSLKKFYWAGAGIIVLVYMSSLNKWVTLGPLALGMSDETCPASFPLTNLPQYDTAAEALEEYFK